MDNRLKALTTLNYLRLFAGPDRVYQMYAHCPSLGKQITMKSVNSAQAIAPHHEFITSGTLEPLPQCEDGTCLLYTSPSPRDS